MRLHTSSGRAGSGTTDIGLVAGEGFAIPYRIVRSARRRRTLELRVERDGVRVAAPLRTSTAEVEAFVRSRIGWIQKQTTARPPSRPQGLLEIGSVPYLGRTLPFECIETPRRRARVSLDLLGLRVLYPASTDAAQEGVVAAALRGWYRARAAEELPRRIEAWADRAGYSPSRVLVRDQKRRWGSCAPDRTIRLNWRLVMMDPRIIDYVLVHEIAHLHHPHHQPAFWAEVERLLPDHRERRRALREAGRALPL